MATLSYVRGGVIIIVHVAFKLSARVPLNRLVVIRNAWNPSPYLASVEQEILHNRSSS